MKRRLPCVARWVLTFGEALLIAAALIFLAEHLEWGLLREAGGDNESRASVRARYP